MKNYPKIFSQLVILGNILFVLWILFNGIDSGFKGTLIQITVYLFLIVLLLTNTYLLYRKNKA